MNVSIEHLASLYAIREFLLEKRNSAIKCNQEKFTAKIQKLILRQEEVIKHLERT